MEPMTIGAASLVLMLVLIWMGIHIAVVLMLLSFVGVWMIRGDFTVAERLLTLSAYESINNYLFGVVPLFVLMGLMVSEADVGRDAYRVAEQLFRRFKGGLGIATIVANAAFAAVTGISIASAAVFTKISVPEMLRAGYAPRLAVGIVAGSSILGMLIPPSLLLIVYAFLADQSIAAMFLAGILPGIILATLMSLYVFVVGVRRPKTVGGEGPVAPAVKPDGGDSAPDRGAECRSAEHVLTPTSFGSDGEVRRNNQSKMLFAGELGDGIHKGRHRDVWNEAVLVLNRLNIKHGRVIGAAQDPLAKRTANEIGYPSKRRDRNERRRGQHRTRRELMRLWRKMGGRQHLSLFSRTRQRLRET
jgi:hypothetical protein